MKTHYLLSFVACIGLFHAFAQPANDDPCNAQVLEVGNICEFVEYTTINATNTPGISTPSCGNYQGQDVWFTVTVPSNGVLSINTSEGSTTDGAMEIYSGTCTSLTAIECDDDDSENGAMPKIALSGLTPGESLFIRFWDYGGGSGTFSICASTMPDCGDSPPAGNSCAEATPICDFNGYCGNTSGSYTANTWSSNCNLFFDCGLTGEFCGTIENNSFLSFVASETTISFDVWVTSTTMGYGIQIYIFKADNGCSGNVTGYGPCYNPGVVEPGSVTISAGGLTIGETYLIMIDGNAGDICDYVIAANSGFNLPVTMTPSSLTICENEQVTFDVTGGDGNYNWDASPYLTSTTGSNITTTILPEGTHEFIVNSTNGNILCPSASADTATIIVENCNSCSITASSDAPICSGNTVNLFASEVVNANYRWYGPSGLIGNTQNITNYALPTSPGDYNFMVTADLGGGDTCSSSILVTVLPLPSIDPGTYAPVCSDANPIALVSSPAGGVFNGIGVLGNSFLPSAGTQNITVDYTDNNGCSNQSQVTITVNPLPTIAAGNNQDLCEGEEITFLGNGGVNYSWDNGIQNGVPFIPTIGDHTYQVTGTDGNGCSNSDEITISVHPLPTIDAGEDQTICEGTSIALEGNGGITYTWDGGVQNGQPFTPTIGSNTYEVTGTDAYGCSNTDQVSINVTAGPTIDAGEDFAICFGESTILTASGGDTYTWDNNVQNGVSFTPTQTMTYEVIGSDANGCSGSDQVTITVHPLPTINAGIDQTICVGDGIIVNASGGTTYTWSDGIIDGETIYPTVGTYTYSVQGTDANGCSNSDQITITVLTEPHAEIYVDSSSGQEVFTIDYFNYSTNADYYTWNFAGDEITSVDTETITYSFNSGEYTITLTASNGYCEDVDTLVINVTPTTPPFIEIPNVFTPNGDGANDLFFINSFKITSLHVIILNRWGNLMYEYSEIDGHWDGQTPMGPAEEGVYFIRYEAMGEDGENYSGHGNITLLR